MTSGISISLGIASLMVHQKKTNPFIPNQYHSLASLVSINMFVISEIALLGGVSRFTLASDFSFHPRKMENLLFPKFHLLYFLPLLFLSTISIFLLMLFPGSHCNKHGRFRFFLLLKLFFITSFITFWSLDCHGLTNKYLTPHKDFFAAKNRNYTILPSKHQLEKNNSFDTYYLTFALVLPINIILGVFFFFF
jgi:hypothetical protein